MTARRGSTKAGGARIEHGQVAALLAKYEPKVRRLLRRHLFPGDKIDVCVDDLVQEVWTAAFLAARSTIWDGELAFERWLVKVTRLRLYMSIRSGTRYRRRLRQWNDQAKPGLSGELASPDRTPSREASAHEAATAIYAALTLLPPTCREVVWMRHFEGRSLAEIATSTETSIGTVRTHLYRGIQRLRDELGWAGKYFSDADSSDHLVP